MITEQEFKDYRNLYTVKLDDNGNVELSRTYFPSQFTEEKASKILNMNWVSRSSKRKPTLEVLNAEDWYQNRIML